MMRPFIFIFLALILTGCETARLAGYVLYCVANDHDINRKCQ
jgi:hypothetical protein